MAQARQNSTVRRHHVQPPVQPAAVDARSAREQLEQLTRKLAAAQAEIRRYQTRLFACERQMVALRRENAELEAACEEARQQALQAATAAEAQPLPAEPACPEQAQEPAAQQPEAAPQTEAEPEKPQAEQKAAAQNQPAASAQPVQEAAQPPWCPKTKLDHLSVELMDWFDKMMGA